MNTKTKVSNIKKWQIAKPAPRKFIESEPEYSPTILQLLYNRGITAEKEMEQFLNPDWERDLLDPFLLKGMKKAVDRIWKACQKKEKIGLFGHHDVDGVASTVLLYLVLEKLGASVSVYLPGREEGYGLSSAAIEEFVKEKVKLLVTVDNGTTSFEGIKLARCSKIDVIIVDHHEILKEKGQDKIPSAYAFINPWQKKCSYPFKELAGVGVVFKLAQALVSNSRSPVSSQELKWLMDIVALGTICDVVPLIGENRLFAKFGLVVLKKTRRLGLQKLYEISKINPREIDSYTVGFILGPRLNAPGRMDHANSSFYLLLSKKPEEASRLAKELDQTNRKRQAVLEKLLSEARKEVEDGRHLENKLILIGRENWPAGLLGLIAGKLKDKYSRPVVALSLGKAQSRGSARSIDALHITETLAECSDYLVRFGGHHKAAGFTCDTGRLEDLKNKLLELAEERLTEEDIIPALKIDAKIDLSEINWDLWQELEKFEPTGLGNPRPVFLAEKVKIDEARVVGRNSKHLKMKLNGLNGIYFGAGDLASSIRIGVRADIIFQIEIDEWNAERRLNLKIIDLRSA